MLLRQNFPELIDWDVQLTAVDISSEMIKKAKEGLYSQFEVNRGLPAKMLIQNFDKSGIHWRISESIRSMVQFREMNLSRSTSLGSGIDLFFMRNILIYFDKNERKRLLEQARDAMRPDGCLMLGAAETTVFSNDIFVPLPVEFSNLFYLKGTPAPYNLNPNGVNQ